MQVLLLAILISLKGFAFEELKLVGRDPKNKPCAIRITKLGVGRSPYYKAKGNFNHWFTEVLTFDLNDRHLISLERFGIKNKRLASSAQNKSTKVRGKTVKMNLIYDEHRDRIESFSYHILGMPKGVHFLCTHLN